jgi:hypothetical protein
LVIFTYVSLARNPPEAYVFTLISFYAIALLSTMEESLSIFAGTCLFLILRTIRMRFYDSTPRHFTWAALGVIFGFHFITWFTAWLVSDTVPRVHPLNWLLEILLTALITRPLFHFCIWVDVKTKRVTLSELE